MYVYMCVVSINMCMYMCSDNATVWMRDLDNLSQAYPTSRPIPPAMFACHSEDLVAIPCTRYESAAVA